MTKRLFTAFFLFLTSLTARGDGIDYPALTQALAGDGLVGWIHGSVADQGLFVFTWRDERDFFNNAQFPLVSHVPAVTQQLALLGRHDKVKIKGQFLVNTAPIRHIYATDIQLITPFDSGSNLPPYTYETRIPDDLVNMTSMIAKVHAIDGGGKVLVIEYKDVVLPVFVQDAVHTALTSTLYRGDKINLKFKLRSFPNQPAHIEPDSTQPDAITVLRNIVQGHGQPVALEGTLVRFPKSPQVVFDVFAMQLTDADSVTWDHTLVNFEDPALFDAIRKKAGDAWAAHTETVINGRNKEHNPRLHVKVKGLWNVVSPGQANPQVIISSLSDLEITFQ